jgi:micrococcal nuclease
MIHLCELTKRRVLFSLLALGLALPGAACAELAGVVVGILDGNTLAVRVDQRVFKVRLAGIDAPVAGQPFGARAWQSLVEVCDSKAVTLDELEIARDRWAHAEVECAGIDASEEQVRRGMAWVLERDAPGRSALDALEREARAERRGLWSDAEPIPPWKWTGRASAR